jgi:hypothetical protein
MTSHNQIGNNSQITTRVLKSVNRSNEQRQHAEARRFARFGPETKTVSVLAPRVGRSGPSAWAKRIVAKWGEDHPYITRALLFGEKISPAAAATAIAMAGVGAIGFNEAVTFMDHVDDHIFNLVEDQFFPEAAHNTTVEVAHSTPTNTSTQSMPEPAIATPTVATRSRSSESYPPLIEEVGSSGIRTGGLIEKTASDNYLIPAISGVVEMSIAENGSLDTVREFESDNTDTLEELVNGEVIVSEERDDKQLLTRLKPTKDGYKVMTSVEIDGRKSEIIQLNENQIYIRGNNFHDAELRKADTLELIEETDMYLLKNNGQLFNLSLEGQKDHKFKLEMVNSNLDVVAKSDLLDAPYDSDVSVSIDSHQDKICISIESIHSLDSAHSKNTTLMFQRDGGELKQIARLPTSGVCNLMNDGKTMLMQKLVENNDGDVVVKKTMWNVEDPQNPYISKEELNSKLNLVVEIEDKYSLGLDIRGVKTYIIARPEGYDPTKCTITADQPINMEKPGVVNMFKESFGGSMQGTEKIFHSRVSGIIPDNALEAKLIMEDANSGQRLSYDISANQDGSFTVETEAEKINLSITDLFGVHGLGEVLDNFGNNFKMMYKIQFRDSNGYLEEKAIGLEAKQVTTYENANFAGVDSVHNDCTWDVKANDEVIYGADKKVVLTFGDISMAKLTCGDEKDFAEAQLNENGEIARFWGKLAAGETVWLKEGPEDANKDAPQYGLFCGSTIVGTIGLAYLGKREQEKRQNAAAKPAAGSLQENVEAEA